MLLKLLAAPIQSKRATSLLVRIHVQSHGALLILIASSAQRSEGADDMT